MYFMCFLTANFLIDFSLYSKKGNYVLYAVYVFMIYHGQVAVYKFLVSVSGELMTFHFVFLDYGVMYFVL